MSGNVSEKVSRIPRKEISKRKKSKVNKKNNISVLLGAAFIMATSAVGPGFLTQAGVFTATLGSDFAFVISISLLITIVVQLTFWKILCVSNMRAQEIANTIKPGLGYILAFAIVLGGLAFNIGNVGGAAMGLDAIFGIDARIGALLSGGIGIIIFSSKNGQNKMDKVAQILGGVIILMIAYVCISTSPPVGEAVKKVIWPSNVSSTIFPILTLVGGTVGGYISFAGGHRLLDAGIHGKERLQDVDKSAIMGIAVSGIIRITLFLAILGVITKGFELDSLNPTGSAFGEAVGNIGYKLFGGILFAAGITSVIGAAYTSVSFIKTFDDRIKNNENKFIVAFIAISTIVMAFIGQPVTLLIFAGAVNGLILPFALAIILIASKNKKIVGDYKLPSILLYSGWVIVGAMSYLGISSIVSKIAGLI